ncbi:MAG: hypothetical protein K0U79_13495 [Gammaproteobacteria bacterium]|nr:hypothetical protein [Gammaproteobacteria bacterium]
MNPENLCLLAAGAYFLTGLLTGVWKYAGIARTEQAQAPVYVDVAHRAALMYAFSALLLRAFVPYSPLSASATVWLVAVPLLFFAGAIASYVLHGLLRDTDNQFRKPYRLGRGTLPGILLHGFMVALAIGEIGAFVLLFYGFVRTLL